MINTFWETRFRGVAPQMRCASPTRSRHMPGSCFLLNLSANTYTARHALIKQTCSQVLGEQSQASNYDTRRALVGTIKGKRRWVVGTWPAMCSYNVRSCSNTHPWFASSKKVRTLSGEEWTLHIYIHILIHVYMYIYTHTYIHTYDIYDIYIYMIYTYIWNIYCMYIYIYIYSYIW